MSIPVSWMDSLFARLIVRYGAVFTRQYEGLDLAAVKADWADVLSGCKGTDIGYALKYLPEGMPPNAMQFRAICRRAPDANPPRLEAPKADPARVAAIVAKLAEKPADGMSPAERVAYVLRKKIADGVKLTPAQKAQLAAIERMSEPSAQVGGEFKAIQAEVLPWSHREAA